MWDSQRVNFSKVGTSWLPFLVVAFVVDVDVYLELRRVCIPHAFRGVPDVLLLYPHKQTELGVLQRAMEGLQQRLEEAERDKRQASELHSSSTSKVRRFSCRSVLKRLTTGYTSFRHPFRTRGE